MPLVEDAYVPRSEYAGRYRHARESFNAAADGSAWFEAFGPFTLQIRGGATYTVEVQRATKADKSDVILVDTITEADDRVLIFDNVGISFWRIDLNALTSGPVDITVSFRS